MTNRIIQTWSFQKNLIKQAFGKFRNLHEMTKGARIIDHLCILSEDNMSHVMRNLQLHMLKQRRRSAAR